MSTKGTWCGSLYLEESVYASVALFVVAINLEFKGIWQYIFILAYRQEPLK